VADPLIEADQLIPPHPAHGLSCGRGVEALVLAILDGHHALYKVGRRLEDRETGPQHRFRLRTPDGVIDVAQDPASGRWTVEHGYAPQEREPDGVAT